MRLWGFWKDKSVPNDVQGSDSAYCQSDHAGQSEGDSLTNYLRMISRIPLLTRIEELVLAERLRRGDRVAQERMIRGNLRLVVSIARRYRNMGLPLADLIGEGNLGLIKAVGRFKHEKGFKFSTYASKWIKQAITKALAKDSRTVRLPAKVTDILRRVRVAEEDLAQAGHVLPSEKEVRGRLGIKASRYAEIINASSAVSLDSPATPDEEASAYEVLADSKIPAPDEEALSRVDNARVEDLLSNLSRRERQILAYRFGLNDGNLRSLDETGKMIGITRQRVKQIEKRAILKMNDLLRKRRRDKLLRHGLW